MARHKVWTLIGVGALLAGCQARPALEPLTLGEVFPATYSGSVGPMGGSALDGFKVAQEPADPPVEEHQPPSEGPYVTAQAMLVRMDAAEAERSFGLTPYATRAVTADRQQVAARLEALRGAGHVDVLQSPSITLAVGQRADMQMIDQVTYLKGFALESRGEVMLADPELDVAHGGLRFDLKAHELLADQPLRLDLGFTLVDVVQPLAELEVDLPLARGPTRVQVPLYVRQKVTTTVAAGPDQTILVSGLHGANVDEVLLVVLRVDVAPTHAALTGAR